MDDEATLLAMVDEVRKHRPAILREVAIAYVRGLISGHRSAAGEFRNWVSITTPEEGRALVRECMAGAYVAERSGEDAERD